MFTSGWACTNRHGANSQHQTSVLSLHTCTNNNNKKDSFYFSYNHNSLGLKGQIFEILLQTRVYCFKSIWNKSHHTSGDCSHREMCAPYNKIMHEEPGSSAWMCWRQHCIHVHSWLCVQTWRTKSRAPSSCIFPNKACTRVKTRLWVKKRPLLPPLTQQSARFWSYFPARGQKIPWRSFLSDWRLGHVTVTCSSTMSKNEKRLFLKGSSEGFLNISPFKGLKRGFGGINHSNL